jgi:hypothetical protein
MKRIAGGIGIPMLFMFLSAAVFLWASMGMLRKQEPFYSWFYSFAWWSAILFIEAFMRWRTGRWRLFDKIYRLPVYLGVSVFIWLVFEAFNFRLQNWHYVQLPSSTGLRWLGYTVAFATVLPAIRAVTAILDHAGLFGSSRCRPLPDAAGYYRPFVLVGLLFLLLPLVQPRFFFPLVWGGFIFLLEPVNHRFGGDSLLRDWENGSLRCFYLLLAAGMICGLLWELWNFRAGSKWIYTIPYAGFLKVFEMPLLGFLGFPPFAVECYVMTNSFRLLAARMGQDVTPGRAALRCIPVGLLMFLFCVLVFMGIDRFTVKSFGN